MKNWRVQEEVANRELVKDLFFPKIQNRDGKRGHDQPAHQVSALERNHDDNSARNSEDNKEKGQSYSDGKMPVVDL